MGLSKNYNNIFVLFEKEYQNHLDTILHIPNLSNNYKLSIYNSLYDLENLNNDSFSCLIIYINIKTIDDILYNNLKRFIYKGGGMMAFHSTTNSFRNQLDFSNIIGSNFVRHGKIAKYNVDPKSNKDVSTFKVNSFSIEDELFRQKYHKNIKVNYLYKTNRIIEPIIWSNRYGKGNVIVISPGHRIETLKNINLQTIIINGLKLITKNYA